jgi:hypothetical protein
MQVVGVTLTLVMVLLLSHFLGVIATRFHDASRVQKVTWFYLYTGLLLGGSAGVGLTLWRGTAQPIMVIGLVAGWAVALVWHLAQIVGASRCVTKALSIAATQPASGSHRIDIKPPKRYSGIHRLVWIPMD